MANGIVRYRRLFEFLIGIRCEQHFICSFDGTLEDILKGQNIVDVLDFNEIYSPDRQRVMYPRTILVLENGTFYESKLSKDFIFDLKNDWNSFKDLRKKSKELILDALREIGHPSMLIRYRSEHIEDYCERIIKRDSSRREE